MLKPGPDFSRIAAPFFQIHLAAASATIAVLITFYVAFGIDDGEADRSKERQRRQLTEAPTTPSKDPFPRETPPPQQKPDPPKVTTVVPQPELSQPRIQSEPSGAQVFIRGKRAGITPFDVPSKHTADQLRIVLKKRGYYNKRVIIDSRINVVTLFKLTPRRRKKRVRRRGTPSKRRQDNDKLVRQILNM